MKKKALLIALTAAFGIGALTLTGIKQNSTSIVSVLANEDPEPIEDQFAEEREYYKEEARAMACLDEYEGAARAELEAKLAEVEQAIDNAEDPHIMDGIVGDFYVYLDFYFFHKYHAPLSYYKNEIKWGVEVFVSDFNIDPTYQDLFDEKLAEVMENIDSAKSVDEVDSIFEQFKKYFENTFYRNYRPTDELKQEALDYVEWTLSKLDEYDGDYHSEIKDAAKNAKSFINEATTNAKIYKEYDDYKDYFESIPTLAEIELARVKKELISNMYILCTIGEMSLGNSYEVDVFHMYYDWAFADIENATSVDDAYYCYEGFLDAADDYVPDIRERLELYKGGAKMGTNGDEEDQEDKDEKKNRNVGLITACAVEGGVILLGGIAIAVYFLKNKKRKVA